MSGAFRYRPKFVDIRVRPPEPEADANAPPPEPRPGERVCEHVDCRRPATARAPKSREHADQFYWFCAAHAAEYNKGWNYFEGMSDAQQAQFRADAHVGHRPTWQFKASRMSREAAAFAAKFGSGAAGKGAGAYADAFGMFGAGGERPGPAPRQAGGTHAGPAGEPGAGRARPGGVERRGGDPRALPRPRQALPPGLQRRRPHYGGQARPRDPRLQDAARRQARLNRGGHDRLAHHGSAVRLPLRGARRCGARARCAQKLTLQARPVGRLPLTTAPCRSTSPIP